ncbi:MAG: hypothetical protein ABSH08_22515 [Tepidisphaeraceae bacterium]|jgi:hypothetical protein
MLAIPSISIGSGLTQFLQGIAKQKTSQAAAKVSAPANAGSTAAGGNLQVGGPALFSQIQQTVITALQKAKASGSTKDPNQIVEDSIASLLKNIFSGKSPAATASSTPATQQAFQSELQSAGITPLQFQSDFNAAVQDVQNDLAHPLPTGTTLDVTG